MFGANGYGIALISTEKKFSRSVPSLLPVRRSGRRPELESPSRWEEPSLRIADGCSEELGSIDGNYDSGSVAGILVPLNEGINS